MSPTQQPKQDPVLRYAAIKLEMKLLGNELEFLAEEVLLRVKEVMDEDKKVNVPGGYFKVAEKKIWTYSKGYEAMLEQVERQKKHEQKNGAATFETAEELRFVTDKVKEGEKNAEK